MNFQLFVAKRYLFSKKSTNIINIISLVTGVGVAVGTMALIIVLSVFNGLEDFISSRINNFVPDLKITATQGKSFISNTSQFDKIKNTNNVAYYCEVIEENVLVKYGDAYHPFKIKGVSDNYALMTGINKMMINGEFKLHYNNASVAVIGQEVAGYLSVGLNFNNPLNIYLPNRFASISSNPENAFIVKNIFPIGIFSISHEVDNYIIVPIDYIRDMLTYTDKVTALEIGIKKNADVSKVQKDIQNILGSNYFVKDKYQQNEVMYKVMKTEKLMIYLILTFILLIASFNIIGSLTMLIIDKKHDARIIQTMGGELSKIRKIFLYEGWLITLLGTIVGLILGAIICWLQIKYGFVKLQTGTDAGSFLIDAYPVKMQFIDFIIVFITVFSIGFLISWFPVKYLTKKYIFNSTI